MASNLITRNLSRILRPQTLNILAGRSQSSLNAFEESLYNSPETNISALSSGLRIASEDNGGDTCTVGLWIDAGSRFENESNNGVAHFLEHMIYKGTADRSQYQLEKEVEGMGAYFNAYTSREQTAYYAKCLKKDLPAVLNILGDVIQNPALDEELIEKERDVILRELQALDSSHEDVALDYLHSTAFQGTPLAMSVLGPTSNVKSITKADIENYMNTHYSTPRIVLAAAGGVDHESLVQLAEQNFNSLPTTVSEEGKLVPCRYTGSEVRARDDDIPFAHVTMAVEGCGWANPDYFPLMVAGQIVGSWNRALSGAGSGFGQLVHDTSAHHLAESFNSFNLCYTDTGLWGAYFVCDKMKVDDMSYVMQREWMRLCTSVTDADVNRAKAALKTNLLLQLDGSTATCDNIGRQMLTYGRRISLPELNKRIDMVDAKVVKDISTKYIYDKCPAVAGVGPVEQLPDYNRIRSGMYWLRI